MPYRRLSGDVGECIRHLKRAACIYDLRLIAVICNAQLQLWISDDFTGLWTCHATCTYYGHCTLMFCAAIYTCICVLQLGLDSLVRLTVFYFLKVNLSMDEPRELFDHRRTVRWQERVQHFHAQQRLVDRANVSWEELRPQILRLHESMQGWQPDVQIMLTDIFRTVGRMVRYFFRLMHEITRLESALRQEQARADDLELQLRIHQAQLNEYILRRPRNAAADDAFQ